MKKVRNSFVKEYEYGDYRIYVKNCKTMYEFYLGHKEYGIIMLMYGLAKDRPYNELLDIINKNLIEQIAFYKEEYED